MNAYKIKVFIDGDMYCALIGHDLQDGVAGFGATHVDAIREMCDEIDKTDQSIIDRLTHRRDMGYGGGYWRDEQ